MKITIGKLKKLIKEAHTAIVADDMCPACGAEEDCDINCRYGEDRDPPTDWSLRR